jgi:hypothetical protein
LLAPVELLPTSENLAALKLLAFLSVRWNPATVNLLVLPLTICRASQKKLHCVGVHCSWTDTLAIFHTINMNYSDMSQQQLLDVEPSLVSEKVVFSRALFFTILS